MADRVITLHTWTCDGAPPHELSVSDGGNPQRPEVKRAVVGSWSRCKNDRCAECGARIIYRAQETYP